MSFRKQCTIGSVALALAVTCSPVLSQTRVIDGDTLEIDGKSYRINGIDAPEVGQKCASSDGQWQCGKEAANAMLALVQGRTVSCDIHDLDRYDRYIATCYANGVDLGGELVSAGLAWAFRRFSTAYVDAEETAKNDKRGIWQALNQPAWEFREERWLRAINTSPRPGCPIKGNISKNGHIYHTPWSPWYDRTVISESKGERWFCDELEAVQAGWRAPYWP